LDGGSAHATGAGMDKHLLARLRSAQFEDVQPGGTEYFGNRRRVLPAHALGHRQQVPAIDDYLVSHATAGQQRANPVAHLPAGLAADFDNLASALQPENIGGAWRWRIMAGLLQQVVAVDSGGANRHPDLPRRQRRRAFRTPAQYPAISLQSFHGAPIVISRIGLKREPSGPCRALKNTLTSPDTIPLMKVSNILRKSCLIALLSLGAS